MGSETIQINYEVLFVMAVPEHTANSQLRVHLRCACVYHFKVTVQAFETWKKKKKETYYTLLLFPELKRQTYLQQTTLYFFTDIFLRK